MRRDVCYYFKSDVRSVYNAYLAAASNPVFRRNCVQQPYHTISFGLNFSFKFNMSGGACTIHFIPYQEGTAVDLRFSLAQVLGARYEAYAKQLSTEVGNILGGIAGVRFNVDINEFLREDLKVVSHSGPVVPQPIQKNDAPNTQSTTVQEPVIQQPVQSAPEKKPLRICSGCGVELSEDDVFCKICGTKAGEPDACPTCGNTNIADSAFCNKCGTKLK